MNLRRFLDAGYSLMIEDYLRIPGITLERAIEMVEESFKKVTGEETKPASVSPNQNEQAMATLKARLSGIPNAPVR